jgi:hypothetical protein
MADRQGTCAGSNGKVKSSDFRNWNRAFGREHGHRALTSKHILFLAFIDSESHPLLVLVSLTFADIKALLRARL